MDLKKEFLARRRQYIESEFADLNPAQQEAVYRICGPELVLAGAGTGKTTVVTRRIAYMVKYGNAYWSDEVNGPVTNGLLEELKGLQEGTVEEPSDALIDAMQVDAVSPYNILAITFTNKAANEMKERIGRILGTEIATSLAVSTFHSFCATPTLWSFSTRLRKTWPAEILPSMPWHTTKIGDIFSVYLSGFLIIRMKHHSAVFMMTWTSKSRPVLFAICAGCAMRFSSGI